MAQNGKTKTGKPMSNQDYMNLLYSSDSESDAVPDLKLPPLKGKKQRRRKSSSSKQQEPVCTAWTIIKVIVAFCGLVSIIVLTGLSYWALQRLNELERQIKLQSADKASPDAQLKLQNQIEQVNKTLFDVKKEMEGFNKTLKEMSIKITSLEGKNSELEKSVLDAKEYVDAPSQLHTLANTVAKLGSDQSAKTIELESKLKELEESMKKVAPTEDAGINNQLVKQQLADLQKIVEAGIGNLTKDFNLHESKISSLEVLVQSLSQQSPSLNSSSSSEVVSKLSEQVSATLDDLKQTYLSGNVTERGEFLAFKQETLSNTEKINQTLYTLSHEFEDLSLHLNTIDSAVLNVTSVLNQLKNQVKYTTETASQSTITKTIK
ncbi:EF-hand calcium-binding domain-containing protein 14 [Biomphalaria pfeifferi]|uniref:EF-hand calcium-binding domain-containing protein 14 n=1 Tax=Biomphalaria pfeifferi TaxID=112525 RepID=A0AAD8AUT1_BIOPF|nr:EF-hand calcium-binding domain-containing protein 14 [Biomphalaria pfeifferi]